MNIWGIREGAYVELPVFGPSSERDAAGRLVDFLIDPVNVLASPPQSRVVAGARVADLLGDRYTFDPTISSVLYDSEDSYARARLLYLQSVRGAAGEATDLDDLEDPYAE
jgi:phospholipid-binding lipoprotein MlaA